MRHGSNLDPPNRFETVHQQPDLEHLEWDQEHWKARTHRKIEYIADSTRSIVSQNKSPDIPFRYSINPYRGCVHSCSYCYARPGHEYLGFNAGMDFETKIVVKHEAPALFRQFLSKKSWKPVPIAFSGVTDCYQPAEREFRLTRGCLEVALECRQPISIVTKNALVVRDMDLLTRLAEKRLVHIYLSITTLDPSLAAHLEPRTSIPQARLRAIRQLSEAGIPVGVMNAPLIPGLNDHEIGEILDAARQAGALAARYILLRLPGTVEAVFREWLQRTQPDSFEKIVGRIHQTRDGKSNSSKWGERMVGTGVLAEQLRGLFGVLVQKHGYAEQLVPHDCSQFQVPRKPDGQMRLF